jgi:hypothetical protein
VNQPFDHLVGERQPAPPKLAARCVEWPLPDRGSLPIQVRKSLRCNETIRLIWCVLRVYYVCIINLGYGKGRDNDQPGHHQETGTGWLVRGCASGEPQPERGRIQVAGTVESFVRETVSRVILRPMPLRLPPWLYGSPQTIRMTPQTVRLVPPRLSKDSRWLPPMSVSGQHKSLTLSDRPQSATDRREPRPA